MGIITDKEKGEIIRALEKVREEFLSGEFIFNDELEDIHMNIEWRCTRIAASAKKLHTARSRNDQVCHAMRLFLRRKLISIMGSLLELIEMLQERATEFRTTPMPSYTHLQRAQIISLGMYLHAYTTMFIRDFDRFFDSFKRVNVMPLSAGTGAGVNYPYPTEFVRGILGFDSIHANSLDAVSDRDFIIEFLGNAAITAAHFSRLAEDFCIWSSEQKKCSSLARTGS